MIFREVKPEEYSLLAEVHKLAFKDFFLSSLGIGFLRTYYKACLKESSSIAICAVDENGIVKGFATGSLKASGYYRKLFLKNAFPFLVSIIKYVLINPMAVIRLQRNLNKPHKKEDHKEYAELLSIAVLHELKGSGVAKELLQLFENEVKNRGGDRIVLTTDFKNNNRAIAFYQKCNYSICYDFISFSNRHMYKMFKTID